MSDALITQRKPLILYGAGEKKRGVLYFPNFPSNISPPPLFPIPQNEALELFTPSRSLRFCPTGSLTLYSLLLLRSGVYANNGYLMVSCNRGLNQMRAAICEIRILKELPPRLKRRVELGRIHTMAPISWSDISYYQNKIRLPLVERENYKLWLQEERWYMPVDP